MVLLDFCVPQPVIKPISMQLIQLYDIKTFTHLYVVFQLISHLFSLSFTEKNS